MRHRPEQHATPRAARAPGRPSGALQTGVGEQGSGRPTRPAAGRGRGLEGSGAAPAAAASGGKGAPGGPRDTGTQWRPRPPSWIAAPCLPVPRRAALAGTGGGENSGAGCPTARPRPHLRPGQGYRGRVRRGAAPGRRMAADGAPGRGLPKHCERVWRRRQGRRREPAFTSGSRLLFSRPPLPGLPPSRRPGRRRGTPEAGPRRAPPPRGARSGAAFGKCLFEIHHHPHRGRQGRKRGAKPAPFPEILPLLIFYASPQPSLRRSALLLLCVLCCFVCATPGFSLATSLWASRTRRAAREAFLTGSSAW